MVYSWYGTNPNVRETRGISHTNLMYSDVCEIIRGRREYERDTIHRDTTDYSASYSFVNQSPNKHFDSKRQWQQQKNSNLHQGQSSLRSSVQKRNGSHHLAFSCDLSRKLNMLLRLDVPPVSSLVRYSSHLQ